MKFSNRVIRLAVFAALAGCSGATFAGGFGIGTQSGSGTGNAFAGGAAAADDASVVWFNPAAMTALPTGFHVTGAVHALRPSFKFNNGGSSVSFAAAGTGDGGDGGDWAFVPNGFFAMSITPALRFGVALNAPYGLKTEYDAGWRGRATGVESSIKSVNLSAALAYQVNNSFSIGGGLNVQKFDAKLTNDLTGYALVPPPNPGVITLKADDVGFGFNLGATFQPTAATRIGAHYRSSIKYKLEGTAASSNIPQFFGNVSADLKTPDSVSLSVLHQVTPNLELMGDVTWTKWSNIKQLVVVRSTGAVLNTLNFNWDDTWRFGVGANFRLNAQTKFRFGVAFDQTPTNDVDRTPRLPDQDRTWVALGVQFKPSKQGTLEVGYAHEFLKNASVNVPFAGTTCAAGCLTGTFKNKADIISIQYSHSF